MELLEPSTLLKTPKPLENTTMADDGVPQTISGSKGGGDKSRTPIEAPDSLYSTAIARIVDLLSEGEIVGLENGLKDVFLDETPVMNADGSLNFQSVFLDTRNGTPDQAIIPGFTSVESETGIGVELKQISPWVKSVTNLQLSAVKLRLSVQALSKTNAETGDTNGHRIDYAIDVSKDGGAYAEVFASAFSGKTSSTYERTHRIDLPPAFTTGWNIRVRRLTANDDSVYVQDKMYVQAITEIIDAKLRYPYSALAGVSLDATQFRAIPRRAYRAKGRIIRVPSNYNPVTRAYSGVWNGTFVLAWTTNPAWIYYDLVTNKRYGLGKRVPEARIDKWSLYKIGQYCDELVADGKGGMEPRFECTVYLQRQGDAYRVMRDMASIFRGITYWAGGAVVAQADQPEDPVYTYNNTNVKDGKFSYNGTGRKARHTIAMVSWTNPSNFGKSEVEPVIDEEGIIRYGIQPLNITAFGCISQSQAQRVGRWILLTELAETNAVSFEVGLDGTLVAPGKIIRIADQDHAGRRLGGRLSSATFSSVVVDALPAVVPSPGDTLVTIKPDGTAQTNIIQTVDVGSRTITCTTSFGAIPVAQSVWAVESASLQTQTYRVIGITESSDGISFGIAAVQHNPSKFSAVDSGTKLETRPTSTMLANVVKAPTNVVLTSHERVAEVLASIVLTASWDKVEGALYYVIQWKRGNGDWSSPEKIQSCSAELENAFGGRHWARVWAVGVNNISSPQTLSNQLDVADLTTLPGFAGTIAGQASDAAADAATATAAAGAATTAAGAAAGAAADAAAAVVQEAIDRAAAVNAEVTNRGNAILAERLVWQAGVATETTNRQNADSSLALQISMISAGSGEQFDSQKIWYFDTTAEGWTSNGTPTVVDGFLRPSDHASAAYALSPDNLNFDGGAYKYLKLRIKKVGSPTWLGKLNWTTSTDNVMDNTKSVTVAAPTFNADGIATYDYTDIPWGAVTVRRIRVQMSAVQTATDYFMVDWVAVGRPTPGASVALVQAETQARTDALAAEALLRETLATQVRGAYTGTDVASISAGLIWSERQARTTADGTEVTLRQALSAKLTGAVDPTGLTLTGLSSGLIYDERIARALADSTEVTKRETLSTTLVGATDPTGKTLANVTSGLIYDEKTARSNADGTEVTARQTLSSSLIGAIDPAGKTLANITSGMLYEERTARTNADGAEVSARQTLSAKITGANDPTSLTLPTLSSGLIYDERIARALADASEVTQRQTLTTFFIGVNDPAGKTLANISSGIIYDEKYARSQADSTEVTARQALSSSLVGAVDPAGKTLANISSGLIYDEKYARSQADGTEVTARQALSAILTGVNDPTGKTLATLTSGLIYTEREARVSMNSSRVSDISTLSGQIAGKANASIVNAMSIKLDSLEGLYGINLFPNPSLKYDDQGWKALESGSWRSDGWAWVSGRDYLGAGYAPSGTHNITQYYPGTVPSGQFFAMPYGTAPVEPSTDYIFSVMVANANMGSTTFYCGYYDEAGVAIAGTNMQFSIAGASGYSGGTNRSMWVRGYASGTTPSNARTLLVVMRSETGAASRSHPRSHMMEPMLERKAPGQTLPSPYNTGSTSSVAEWDLMFDVNGTVSGINFLNDGHSSAFKVTADDFQVVSIGGADALTWSKGVLAAKKSSMEVKLGAGFGPTSNMVLFYGATVADNLASMALSKIGVATNGLMKLGGAWGNYSSGWSSGAAITSSFNASTPATVQFNVASGVFKVNGISISYNASAGTVSQARSTTVRYYLYYDDGGMDGGTRTLGISTNASVASENPNYLYIGSFPVVIPGSGGGTGPGGGGSGGGPCMWINSVVPVHGRIGGIQVGHELDIANPVTLELRKGTVTYSKQVMAPCVRVHTEYGTLTCSDIAPIAIDDGTLVQAAHLRGYCIPANYCGMWVSAKVLRVEHLGEMPVQHVTCENECFLAGDSADCYFLHHNLKPPNEGDLP